MKNTEQTELLWTQHEPYIRKLCQYKLQSVPDKIDDCVQEVFLALMNALRDGNEIKNPKAWLTKVALNKINDIYKDEEKKRQTTVPFEEAYVSEARDFDFSPSEDLSEEAIEMHLEKILSSLSDAERKLIEDFYVKKVRQKKLAREMNISENALRQQLFRIKRKIIKEIKKIIP